MRLLANIVVADVDEEPVLEEGNATMLNLPEDSSTDDTAAAPVLAVAVTGENLDYGATDNDDADGDVNWAVSDEDNFEISAQGLLSWIGDGPDFETKKEYKVTISATGQPRRR